ncbi:MAG: 4Fe-4S binding protein [Thermoleophilia bacterium]|nr:4Fe-4S binding protein [Thermoleophilia bacterium]
MTRSKNPRMAMISGMVRDLTGPAHDCVLIRADLCDGCGDCVTACERAVAGNEGEPDSGGARIRIVNRQDAFLPVLCHNCEEAPCVAACMTGCRRRGCSGFIETDYARCMGCGMCIMVCPFGAIAPVGDDHKARKCDGCTGMDTPACVIACRPGALVKGQVLLFSEHVRRRSAAGIASATGEPASGAKGRARG